MRSRLNTVSLTILLCGLALGLAIYVIADDDEIHPLLYEAQISKTYVRELTRFGGKAAVLFDDFNRWFAGLWRGKSLGVTIGWLAVFASGGVFLVARRFPENEEDESMAELTGSCLCGAIRYSVNQPITELRACHCTNCQKSTGSGGSVNAMIPSAAFKLLQGTPKRYSAVADSGRLLHRFFCGDCGSPLYSQRDSTPQNMSLRAGTLDQKDGMKITGNIWTKSARPWAHIDPATQQHPGQPDAPAVTK